MDIAVAGTGYVGLSLAVLLAQNNSVKAVDIVPDRAELINQPTVTPNLLSLPPPPITMWRGITLTHHRLMPFWNWWKKSILRLP